MTMQSPNITMIARNWRDLIRPKGISIDTESANNFYAKFTCEPLERGFGITVGNSLRRVLLSSLQGAAITAIRIEGALHEFTSVPDVVEDVSDIILNLKEVVFKAAAAKDLHGAHRQGRPRSGLRARHPPRRRPPGAQPGPPHRGARQEGPARDGAHRQRGPRLRARRAQQDAHDADRHHPDRCALLADPQGELHRAERARRAGHRLRQAHARGVDQRLGRAPRTRWRSPPRS